MVIEAGGAAKMDEGSAPPSVTFKIMGLPESMNSIYQIIYAQRRVQIKPDVLRYKVQAKLMMPVWKCDPEWLYGINMRFHAQWYYQNKNIRRVDLSNLEKVICDCVSEKYGFDDARIFEKYSWKVQDAREEYVQVTAYQLCGLDTVDTTIERRDEKNVRNNG